MQVEWQSRVAALQPHIMWLGGLTPLQIVVKRLVSL